MFKPLISLCSSTGDSAKLTILIYHRVLATKDPYRGEETDIKEFDWQMRLISRNFRVMKLSKAVELMKKGKLPAKTICITFDDGYADNFEFALPILIKWKMPATFFVSTAFLNGGCMWNDRIIESISNTKLPRLDLTMHELGSYEIQGMKERNFAIVDLLKKIKHLPYEKRFTITHDVSDLLDVKIPTDIMMTSDQVKRLYESGMEIGAHTDTHPILAKIDDKQAFFEIKENKHKLEDLLETKIELFAYPNGKSEQDYTQKHVSMVKELGFTAAVSTEWGVSNRYSDFYQLPRFTPWDKTPIRFMFRLLKNYFGSIGK